VAQRYCTNCGAKQGNEDRFCSSCGRPVHETAAVSTPEADVSVPPAPQEGEEHRPRISLGQFVVGILALIVVLWLLIPTGDGSSGGGGNGGRGEKVVEKPQEGAAKQAQGAQEQGPDISLN
jgi:zinc-ribbon domain